MDEKTYSIPVGCHVAQTKSHGIRMDHRDSVLALHTHNTAQYKKS